MEEKGPGLGYADTAPSLHSWFGLSQPHLFLIHSPGKVICLYKFAPPSKLFQRLCDH